VAYTKRKLMVNMTSVYLAGHDFNKFDLIRRY
jgi:hypothetical protein